MPQTAAPARTLPPSAYVGAMLALIRRHPPVDLDTAGPAFRAACGALETALDAGRETPGGLAADAAASALCEAAEEIAARKGWPSRCVHPWPDSRTCARSCYRTAERLLPGILSPAQAAH